ncbi:MAG: alpha-1,2-fucosyltransferase [Cyclobacteriaceae bacterium]|nr:alpha-1,2-fucosyltransferase [Cyclobacteriaceae bacterium]MDH4298462.1 alpha-1,2-fucosyltransferase [Cyclobacteriaceae bacterium]MDH5248129.1 alpha-1,2-fucosyltransferase [Cyclobacteriaceae bacterium]
MRSLLFILNKGIIKLLRAVSFNNSFFHEVVVADLPEYQFQRGQYCDLNAPFIQVAFKRKNVLLFGRFFRDYRNLEKYQDEIRDFFRPTTAIRQNVSQFLLLARQNAELLVGIHIRRGDYEQFISGKYFFSQEDYLRKMRELLTTGDRRTIAFVICSNEWVNPAVFKGLNFVIGPGHVVKDMYALAGCDFIMGPPSTYTRWASFYGKTPLLQLESLAQQVSFSQFLTLPPERLFDF